MSLDYQPGALTQTTFFRLRQVDTQLHDTAYTNVVTISINPPMVSGLAGDFQIIANNTTPLPLHSLPATGGSGNFIYQWRYHDCGCGPMPCDSLECGPLCSGAPWLVIAGATNLVYNPGVLNQGKCFRMFSTDFTCSQVRGSNYVHIYVSPQLVPGVAAADQNIVQGAVPAMLHATTPTGGTGNYAYQWQSGCTISSFFDIFTEMSLDYQPGALTQTTYYRLKQVDYIGHDSVYTNLVTITVNAPPWVCGNSLPVNHVAGIVAPVGKLVNYSTVNNIPGEPAKCWITRNLGASQQPASVSDVNEASAGWYFQFNRKQGYQYISSRIPATTWITSINESSNWVTASDPCTIELGTGWRIPTSTEWTNVDASGSWINWNGPFGSALKLHAAGSLNSSDGLLSNRGSIGYCWSSTQSDATFSWYMAINISNSSMYNSVKVNGFSLRCLKDN